MLARLRKTVRRLIMVGTIATACAHAQPATGNHDPNAPVDPDHPEQNCSVNNTVDCNPAAY